MSTGEKPFYNNKKYINDTGDINDTEGTEVIEKIEDKDYILKLLKGLNDYKKLNEYKNKYNKLDLNSKEKVLEITIAGLDGEYKGKLYEKEANAFLFINAFDYINSINNYNDEIQQYEYKLLEYEYKLTQEKINDKELLEIINKMITRINTLASTIRFILNTLLSSYPGTKVILEKEKNESKTRGNIKKLEDKN